MKRVGAGLAAILFTMAASALLSASSASSARGPVQARDASATWSGQVAPVLYARCTTCHHPGGAGPFSLLTYQDAKRWGSQLVEVTRSRYMPPWLPEPGYGDFAGNRRLPDAEIALLRRWVASGMPEGDASRAPAAPVYSGEWTLGKPDLVLTMDAPFTTPAGGTDVFRNFILPYPLPSAKYIRAMEILPSGPGSGTAAVHHANVVLDRTGSYRRQHPGGWKTGVPGMELLVDAGSTFDPDSHFLFWKPDSPAIVEPAGMEWRLDPGDDLILNMHLKPTGKPETIQARIGLYFSPNPPSLHPMLLQLEHDAALDIPAGDRAFIIEDQLKLPIAVNALGVYPHAHYLGKDLEAWAILPDGAKKWLVWIKDWDIDRQSIYRYRSPLLLPAGTVLHMRYVYDNSAQNPRNPHQPPARVKAGNRSEDEMGHLWLQVLPVEDTVAGKDSRLLLEQAWMANRLHKDPDDALALYNMASAEEQGGNPKAAVALYRRILAHNSRDTRTLTALGAALASSGDAVSAAASYQEAMAIQPEDTDARFDLAQLELAQQQYPQAEQQLRQLTRMQPRDPAAHSALGVVLLRQEQTAAAKAEFQLALQLDAEDPNALASLGQLALMDGNLPEAIQQLRAALRLQNTADTHEKLAMAFAQSQQMDAAAAELQAAIALDPGSAEAHALLAQVYGTTRPEQAIREQQAALAIAPGDADGWNNLGVLHARQGQTAEARKDFQKALHLVPDHPSAAANLRRLEGSGQP